MITGLDDNVCYPETQFAIYNRLEGPKEHLIMPEYAHEAMMIESIIGSVVARFHFNM